jgi:XRE family transcriptional regulator, regulator of sulfur utilization
MLVRNSADRNNAVPGAVQPIARNLRRWRTTREMTLSALAREAGVAKSTVSLIERGQGNPSIDTVWALASALGVPFASLFHDDPPAGDVTVVRADDASVIAVDPAGLPSEGLIIRPLLTRPGGDLIEIYTLALDEGAVRHSDAHASGLFEHLTITAGTVEIATTSFCEVLGAGDLISFRADQPHSYRVLDGPATIVSVHEYSKAGE